ncbi:hypothetical protein CKAN_00141300 [Cinnamomum micranthum f. kanehirae]|uniref:Uncharacterized protein n=1 Tax=Cinnamomum micranthum f. kanehirae TaxID=337451 RepID=A0A443N3P9_9MAGN|nr:hypothetical protein CKAN_00141300 [Cinnamomum micranthum f. kanehirae]
MSNNVPFTQPLTEEQISSHNISNPKTLFPDSDERLEDINSSSNDDMGIEHLNRNRSRAIKTTTTPRQKRFKTTMGDRLCEEISKMVASTDRLNSVNSIPPKDPYAYELCMEELQKMESLEEETFMQAIEVLRDRQYAIAFMTLKEPMRLKWLQKKCGGT